MTKEELKCKFICHVTNEFRTIDYNKGTRQYYKRPDLDKWSEEFYNKGKLVFYAEPVDPKNPCGELRLSEKKVEYKAILTEEEFNYLFNE